GALFECRRELGAAGTLATTPLGGTSLAVPVDERALFAIARLHAARVLGGTLTGIAARATAGLSSPAGRTACTARAPARGRATHLTLANTNAARSVVATAVAKVRCRSASANRRRTQRAAVRVA